MQSLQCNLNSHKTSKTNQGMETGERLTWKGLMISSTVFKLNYFDFAYDTGNGNDFDYIKLALLNYGNTVVLNIIDIMNLYKYSLINTTTLYFTDKERMLTHIH